MAKTTVNKKPSTKAQQTPTKQQSPQTDSVQNISSSSGLVTFLNYPLTPYLIILLFTTGIYFNTIWNTYAIDDTLVLTENKFTLQGFSGIKDLMTHDAFVGFFGERGS